MKQKRWSVKEETDHLFFESMLKLWGGVELWYIYYITLVTLCKYLLQPQIRSTCLQCGHSAMNHRLLLSE